ncbi:MAG: TIGR04282 family arsenosugar biosynthesis glycosyltransferase [Mariprofundus sp.]|nr:TIGR04282 family arsenosugar biosynthesis glycosyltransferase [Mariprofundus sp.]
MRELRIVMIAKAPVAGFAKTRLIPALGESGAASVAAKLITHTAEQAVAAKLGAVELCAAPDAKHPIWQILALPETLLWSDQQEGDLGDRMAAVVKRLTDKQTSVLLIGADCPSLDAALLRQAAAALENHDAVMVPATDGGYVLLGLNQDAPSVFSNISWSSSTVFKETMDRLTQLGWSVCLLPERSDIDLPADLKQLPAGWMDELFMDGLFGRVPTSYSDTKIAEHFLCSA